MKIFWSRWKLWKKMFLIFSVIHICLFAYLLQFETVHTSPTGTYADVLDLPVGILLFFTLVLINLLGLMSYLNKVPQAVVTLIAMLLGTLIYGAVGAVIGYLIEIGFGRRK